MFLTTIKKGNFHNHIAYVNEQKGQGVTSVTKGHSHNIVFSPIFSNVPNPSMGQLPPVQTGGSWLALPASDGHDHQLTEYVPKAVENVKEDDAKVVNDVTKLYKESREYERDARKDGEESERFYQGDGQWEKTHRERLENEDRACLTINEIEPKIDILAGYQRQNRTDLRFMPTEEGDQIVADILNVVAKNVTEQCNFAFEESLVFEDQAITGRGNFNVYVDLDSNIEGDIKIEKYPWKEIFYGPHEKYDLSDCEYIVKVKWMSKAKIEQLWPDKKDSLTRNMDALISDEGRSNMQYRTGNYVKDVDTSNVMPSFDADMVNIQRKEYLVMECWRKEYIKTYVLTNPDENVIEDARNWPTEDVNAVKTIPGFFAIPRNDFRMRVTTIGGFELLDDDYPDLPVMDFHIVPCYAKKRGNKWWGKVQPAKDAQREINKRHSQWIDIVNKSIAYGWFYDSNTFPDRGKLDEFKKQATKPGFVLEVMNLSAIPVKVEGLKYPTEIAQLIQLDSLKIKEIMNINEALMGISQGDRESGVAMMQKKHQGLLGNEFLYDNLAFAKKKIGKLIVAYIQKYYSPERIMRIVNNQNIKQPVMLGQQPLQTFDQDAIMAMLKNADLTKYDLAVSESPYSPTNRLANFMIWSDLAGKGLPVPPQLLVDLSDLPGKDKVLQGINQMLQTKQQEQQMKYDMEIRKTAISKGTAPQGQPQGAVQMPTGVG